MKASAYPDAFENTSLTTAPARPRVWGYIELVKPRVISLIVFTAVIAYIASARSAWTLETMLLLVVSGTLSAGGAAAINHYADRDIDARMGRTRHRPLALGSIRNPRYVLIGGVIAVALGVGVAAIIDWTTALCELLGALIYAGVYTSWLKRRSPLNIVIGGAAGSVAVLGGWSAAGIGLDLAAWLLAALVFFWTPAHFWSLALARDADYALARVPMLPIVVGPKATARWIGLHIVLTVACSLAVAKFAQLGPLYVVIAALAGAGFVYAGFRLIRSPRHETGWRVFKLSGAYLGLVFCGIFGDLLARWYW